MSALSEWIDRQYQHSARAMLRSVSPTQIVKERPGFGQHIRAGKGAVIASPVLGAYDPHPDYFFHWFRDSAVVIDALRLLYEDHTLDSQALGHFSDFVQFSLNLQQLDGRTLVTDSAWRRRIQPDFEQFIRPEGELAAVRGDAVVGETRVNPDGTLDISKWGRPQNDGPPLRALSVLRWLRAGHPDRTASDAAAALLRSDLDYTAKHWQDACYDIWEEEKGLHYYTLCVSARALTEGAQWLDRLGDPAHAQTLRSPLAAMRTRLDQFWAPESRFYRSRALESGQRSSKELDIAVILAPIHALSDEPTHSVHDPKTHATLSALERLFGAEYPINRQLPLTRAPAMGRYQGDVYYSGGAYFFSTLGAAEFCFRAAAGPPADARQDTAGRAMAKPKPHQAWIARGDAFLETIRAYTPPDGELSEQFDKITGAPSSAPQLAWSYAAFISCVTARRAVVR
jgi:glucoamylase